MITGERAAVAAIAWFFHAVDDLDWVDARESGGHMDGRRRYALDVNLEHGAWRPPTPPERASTCRGPMRVERHSKG